MSFANHTISKTDIKLSDIRAALIDTDATNANALSGSIIASEMFDPRVVYINRWAKYKPTDVAAGVSTDRNLGASGDWSLHLIRSTTASGLATNFSKSWVYKFRESNYRISDYGGYYASAYGWAYNLQFPAEIKKNTAYTNKISLTIDGEHNDKTIGWQDITRTSGGTALDLGNMYPGYILYSDSRYYLKCSSMPLSASDGTIQMYTMNMTASATNGMTAGEYTMYPVLFEGTPSSAMTGTGAGATSKPSTITGFIPLPLGSRSVSVVGSTVVTTPSVNLESISVSRYGTRVAINATLTLKNPSENTVSSWTLNNVSATDGTTTQSLGNISVSQSVNANSSTQITYTINTTLVYATDITYSLTIGSVTRSAVTGTPTRD